MGRKSSLAVVLGPGLAAVRRYWRPFLLLQAAAVCIVILYDHSPAIQAFCNRVNEYKVHWGLLFSGVLSAFAGGLLPEVAKVLMLGEMRFTRQRLRDIAFALVVFAISGMFTDLQYRALAAVLGHDAHFATAVKKMLADQFITTPIYGTPYWVVMYGLRARRYNVMAMLRDISPRWYRMSVLPLLISGWAFWIPMTLAIYSLPGAEQFLLFCFALAAWSLLMVFVATHDAGGRSTIGHVIPAAKPEIPNPKSEVRIPEFPE